MGVLSLNASALDHTAYLLGSAVSRAPRHVTELRRLSQAQGPKKERVGKRTGKAHVPHQLPRLLRHPFLHCVRSTTGPGETEPQLASGNWGMPSAGLEAESITGMLQSPGLWGWGGGGWSHVSTPALTEN